MWRRLLIVVAGGGLGLLALLVVRREPGYSASQGTLVGVALLLAAGGALVVAAVVASTERRRGTLLLLGLSGAWFVAEQNSPAAPAVLFTLGLVWFTAWPAVAFHLAARLTGSRWPAAMTTVGYVATVGVQATAALVLDPAAQGCSTCSANLLGLVDAPRTWARINELGLRLAIAWLVVAILVLLWWLVRSGPARRRDSGLVVVAVLVALGLTLSTYAQSLEVGFVVNDSTTQRIWQYQAVALLAMAGAAVAGVVGTRRARRALARVARGTAADTDLGADLAARLGDPSLVVAYPVEGGYVDRTGRPAAPSADGRALTLVRRGQDVLAAVGHRPDLDCGRVADLAQVMRLGLQYERLCAEALAQLESIRRSGTSLVAAGDTERRRLERDLHDGAQQSLIAVLLQLGLLGVRTPEVEAAERHLRGAVEHVRRIAHGLHPLLLERAGLAVALSALAETRPLTVLSLPAGRLDPVVESTVYQLVERCCGQAPARVHVAQVGASVHVDIGVRGEPGDLTAVRDRITTLDGRLLVSADPVTVRASVPTQTPAVGSAGT